MKHIIPTIHLQITQAIIDKSEQKHATKCMLATAIREQVPGASSVHVTAERVKFNKGEHRFMWDLPAKPKFLLNEFDKDKALVKPFPFQLDGRLAFARPISYNPKAKPRGPTRRRLKDSAKPTMRHCARRYHGLATVQPVAA